MNDDIKHALGSAFTEEPPLRVYRDEVLRQGRTRLRRQRLTVAGGFAAAVAVVAFSASLVVSANSAGQVDPAGTGFGGAPTSCDTSTAPAVSTGRPSPPVQPTGSRSAPPSSAGGPSSLTGQPRPVMTTGSPTPCESTSKEHADELTAVLRKADIVPGGYSGVDTGNPKEPGVLMFGEERAQYTASADLIAPDGQEGTMYVMVGGKTSNSARPDCTSPVVCEHRPTNDGDVQITTVHFGSAGEILTMVDLQRTDGTQVYAMTSNVSVRAMSAGKGKAVTPPSIDHQPLTADQLVKLVTMPGMKF
jgi:hypothetical protein